MLLWNVDYRSVKSRENHLSDFKMWIIENNFDDIFECGLWSMEGGQI
jgi:hypothetical protein